MPLPSSSSSSNPWTSPKKFLGPKLRKLQCRARSILGQKRAPWCSNLRSDQPSPDHFPEKTLSCHLGGSEGLALPYPGNVMPRSTYLTSSCLHCFIRLIVRCLHCCNCAFVHVGNIAYIVNLNIFCTATNPWQCAQLLQTLDNVYIAANALHIAGLHVSAKEHFLPHKAQFIRREMRLPRGQATETNKRIVCHQGVIKQEVLVVINIFLWSIPGNQSIYDVCDPPPTHTPSSWEDIPCVFSPDSSYIIISGYVINGQPLSDWG